MQRFFIAMNWQAQIFVGVLFLTFIASFFKKRFPIDLIFAFGSTSILLTGILPARELMWSIFNEAVVSILSLFVITKGWEKVCLYPRAVTHFLQNRGINHKNMGMWLGAFGTLGAFLDQDYLCKAALIPLQKTNSKKSLSLSIFLWPMSYVIILGGACSLIGSALNLIAKELLRRHHPSADFYFFETGYVGLPCLLIGVICISFFSPKLNSKKEQIFEEGKQALVPLGSSFIGKKASDLPIIALYRKGEKIDKEKRLEEGDLLFFKEQKDMQGISFLLDQKTGVFSPLKAILVGSLTLIAIGACALGIPIYVAVLSTALLFIFFRLVSLRNVIESIRWDVIILTISGFLFASALEQTGLAKAFASNISPLFIANPYFQVGFFFICTLILVIFVPQIIALALMFPIAIHSFQLKGADGVNAAKACGLTLLFAVSFSFLKAKNRPTYVLVESLGRYQTADLIKMEFPLNIILFLVCLWLIPQLFLL
jgi:di/tricarboxylate transporter